MHNALRVLIRDFRRILRVPKVWAIVVGLLIMPSLYAWVNIIAFWDPYSNTGNLKVAVVNLDRGGSSPATGELNVGDQVVAQLRDNHQLGWQFLDEGEAMTAVRSGSSYAAIVIPADFSSDVLSLTTGQFVRPELEYYVNQKVNAISPKITDVGASTLDTQINSAFVSAVAKTVAEDLQKAGVDTGTRAAAAQNSTLSALDDAISNVQSARTGVNDIEASLASAQSALRDTRAALLEVDRTIAGVQSAVAQTQDLAAEAQQELTTFTDSMTNAFVSGAVLLSDASSKLNGTIANVTTGAQQANVAVGSAVTDVTAVVDANARSLERLQALVAELDTAAPTPTAPVTPTAPATPTPTPPVTPTATPTPPAVPVDPALAEARAAIETAIARLQQQNTANQALLSQLQGLNTDVAGVITAIQANGAAINTAVADSAASASSVRSVLMGTIPEINRSMSALSASAGAFSSALGSQKVLVAEAVELLTALEGQLRATVTALEALDSNLEGAQQDLQVMRTDVMALSSADIWNRVRALTDLNPEQIAEFMTSPVKVNQHTLYPVPTYGSGMAPLFTNLSLWIGAFMLIVLIRQEVDTEGVGGLTVRQAYLGRFMLLAMLNMIQALIVSIGVVIIGVQTMSALAFVATSVFIGLVYLSIIYALALSFGYIGKGMALLLVIMQIPGASGIYPIQMMPGFFQALFPLFPFTYGINAMREVIGGFYDAYYLRAIGVLLLFAALSFILGIFLRQRLGNFARLFNRELSDTGLFVPEDVQILGSRRRLTQIVQALTDRDKFWEQTARRADWYDAHSKTFVRVTLLIGLLATVLLLGFGWTFPDAKTTVLGLWGVLLMLVMGALVTFEYLQHNIVIAAEVGEMPDPELQKALKREEAATHSDALLDEISGGVKHK